MSRRRRTPRAARNTFTMPRTWRRRGPKSLAALSPDARAAERATKEWRRKNGEMVPL